MVVRNLVLHVRVGAGDLCVCMSMEVTICEFFGSLHGCSRVGCCEMTVVMDFSFVLLFEWRSVAIGKGR